MSGSVKLNRVLGFWALVAFGVGDILGAGIYALVGKIAGVAGPYCWLAFAVAMVVAAFTALSYAELGSRFPKSGGEATFTHEAFHSGGFTLLIGWLVLFTGIVSTATVAKACAGYLGVFIPGISKPIVIIVFLMILMGIAMWGMRQTSIANIICTAIELTGLLVVIFVGLRWIAGSPEPVDSVTAITEFSWTPILYAAALAFYAFIGFEDMVNVSEEVAFPERDMPKAILTALLFAGCIYMVVAYIATTVISPAELSASSAPLVDVVRRAAPAIPIVVFTIIALFAVSNTALLNLVMGSRLLYGMASDGFLPKWLSIIHPTRKTPHFAIAAIFVVATVLALSGTLVLLAGTTSVLILCVFIVVNASLIKIRRKDTSASTGFRVPIIFPVIGVLVSSGLLVFVPLQAAKVAFIIVLLGFGLIGINRLALNKKINRI